MEPLTHDRIRRIAPVLLGVEVVAGAVLWALFTVAVPGGLPWILDTLAAGALAVLLISVVLYRLGSVSGLWMLLEVAVSVTALAAAVRYTGGLHSPLWPLFAPAWVVHAVVYGSPASWLSLGLAALGLAWSAACASGHTTLDVLPPLAPFAFDIAVGLRAVTATVCGVAPAILGAGLRRQDRKIEAEMAKNVEASEDAGSGTAHAMTLESATFETILPELCAKGRELLGATWAFVWLAEGDEHVGYLADGPDVNAPWVSEVLSRDPCLLNARTLRQMGALALNAIDESPYADRPVLQALRAESALFIPLVGKGGFIGIIMFADARRDFFDLRRQRQAASFAHHAASAIDRAMLLRRASDEAERVSTLLELSNQLGTSTELDQVVSRVARTARVLLRADDAAVLLWDRERQSLKLAATADGPGRLFPDAPDREYDERNLSFLEDLLNGRTIFLVGNEIGAWLRPEQGAAGVVVAPMMTTAGLQGVLVAVLPSAERGLTRDEASLVEGLSRQAALAIDNSRLVRDLRQANQLKSEFVATMSHELRTPLNIILGYTDLLTEGHFGSLVDDQRDVLSRVRQSSLQLQELINATLDLNRLDSGRAPVHLSRFTLPELFHELEAETESIPRREGVALRWETPSVNTPIVSDRGKLKTILKNLVGNALKFTDKGAVTVRAAADPANTHIELTVNDTGIGIRSADLTLIFDMFRQADNSDTRRHGGVGLGLYIVKRLVEQLEGDIRVESTPGVGSVFIVRMPYVPTQIAERDETLGASGPSAEAPRGLVAAVPRVASAGGH